MQITGAMKKIILLILTALIVVSAVFADGKGKPLVIYFSWGEFQKNDLDASTSASIMVDKSEKYGITELLARQIAGSTGADLWRIEPEDAYPAKYNPCTEVVDDELKKGIIRQVKGSPDFSKYDTIFVGCPVWWHTAPTMVTSFLQGHEKELTGKTVIPFVTFWSTFSKETLAALVKATPTAEHKEGFATDTPRQNVTDKWLSRIGEKP